MPGNPRPVFFTFSNELLEEMICNPNEFKKDFEVALKYGYAGHSNGGINGIVRLRDTDKEMARRIRNYSLANPKNAERNL